MNKTVIITGVTGFLGSNIFKRLKEEGYQIAVIVRKHSDLTKYSISGYPAKYYIYEENLEDLIAFMKEIQPDLVIHMAALFIAEHTPEQVKELIQSNITFSTYLYEAMSVCGVKKLINTSTSWKYYKNEKYNPVCLYAATKKAAEDILIYYTEAKGLKAITLELYDTYGPGDKRKKLINLLMDSVKNGESLDMSGGEQEINLVHVSDIVDAYVLSIQLLDNMKDQYREYSLFTDEVYTLREIVNIISKLNGSELNVRWGSRKYRDREVMRINQVKERVPGWQPQYSVKQGLKELFETE